MNEQYGEIIYKTLHFRGCNAALDCLALLEYLQKVFELDDTTHSHLLAVARARKAPKVLLNVEVIEATILKPTDANDSLAFRIISDFHAVSLVTGLSSPFCSLYLTSSNTVHHNTSVKLETLKPIWKEEFQLSVENSEDDVLCVELWNFNPDKTVQEKIKEIRKVKGVKGLKILLKEVVSSAAARKHDNKLIGRAFVPLKDISAAGQLLSYRINKKDKMKTRGDMKLHLTFCFENAKAAFEEHRHLIRNVILHEIKTSQVEPHSWNGNLSGLAEKILIQHRIQSGLSLVSETLAQWIEFSNIHTCHPLSFTIFLSLLQKLNRTIQEDLATEEEMKMFWEAAVTLLPFCLSGIRNIQVLASNKKTINEPSIILRLLSLLKDLRPPRDIILFPAPVNDWPPWKKNTDYCDIRTAVVETTIQGAAEWFSKVTENYGVNDVGDEEEKIKGLCNVVVTVTVSLQKAIDLHDTIFQEYFHFPYVDALYKLFDDKFAETIEPTIASIWTCMNPLKFKDSTEEGIYDNDPLDVGSDLFELYTSLQKFHRLGHTKCQEDVDLTLPNKFHEWFHRGVNHWLCISQYKALHWIQKAVRLDSLVPVYTDTRHSSSACDILLIFEQIKIFWMQLAWPNAKGSEEFAGKIISDICECLIFYADQMCQRVEEICGAEIFSGKKIQMWCLSVTNLNHVQQSSQIFYEFGVEEISTENGRQTVKVAIDNTFETARNKICEAAVQKMMSSISKILMETFEYLDSDEKMGKLMSQLAYNLYTFSSHLDSINFSCLLNIIWKNLFCKLNEVLEINLKRGNSFFKKFHEILQNVSEIFKQLNENVDLSNLTDLEQVLLVHEMDTWELVHQYRMEQLSEQKRMQTSSQGLLTVRMMFLEDILKIEILNARNLKPISSKGCCYPYVKIYLLPERKFLGLGQRKTKTQRNTVFPLFEETFVIQLKSVHQKVENAMVMFVVKEKTFLRESRYLGETLVSFDDIPVYDGTTKFEHLEQMHLKLNLPTKLDSGAFVVLEHYHEELAREFIKSRQLRKCRNNASCNICAFSEDIWGSVINVLSYMSKGPLHINVLPFLPRRASRNNKGLLAVYSEHPLSKI